MRDGVDCLDCLYGIIRVQAQILCGAHHALLEAELHAPEEP